jgi:hypothetical protein
MQGQYNIIFGYEQQLNERQKTHIKPSNELDYLINNWMMKTSYSVFFSTFEKSGRLGIQYLICDYFVRWPCYAHC